MSRTNFRRSLVAASVSALFALSTPVLAANNDGTITGKITASESQSSIAGATIEIINTKTGFSKTIQTDENGQYRLRALPVGTYTITVSSDGFSSTKVESFNVGIGNQSVNLSLNPQVGEVISVTGSRVAMVDTSTSESALNISAIELERIPVPRSVTSVALLAPGTTRGDSRFGGASFGGSSVAENQIYINGLNVTNFRNGLGFSNVPYDFYDQFQVKTGGYSAEFGRSTGGVINAVTKSGSNEFEFGANVYWEPASLRENSPNVRKSDGTWYSYRSDNESSDLNFNISASGAIIEDHLFFYAIYNPRKNEGQYDSTKTGGNFGDYSSDTAFWGAKIDWHINDDHRIELLAFSDEDEEVTDTYIEEDGELKYQSTAYDKSGGMNWSARYIGSITDNLVIKAMYGELNYDLSSGSNVADECQLVYDYRYYYGALTDVPVNGFSVGCATSNDYFVEEGEDTRKAMRLDLEWQIADSHLLKFGFDHETNTSASLQKYSGPDGAYWLVNNAQDAYAGVTLNGVVMTEDTDYIRNRFRTVSGNFETTASAIYIEDIWNITDSLTASIGLRQEAFDNKNGDGDTFVKIDDMLAPRLGISWDINGDGESKLFANYGRYFLPVANNTNVRLAGNEYDSRTYYVLEGWQQQTFANGNTYYDPILGEQIGAVNILADGSVPDTRSVVDADLDPMAQDEFILGYQAMINEDWRWGVKFTHRVMDGAIDDMIIDHAIASKFGCQNYHPHQYVLGNPGEEMTVYTDTNCDGDVDGWATFTPEELVYDKAERKYNAIDLNFARQWDGVWSLDATYTWSQSYGNAEGLVKSDNGQTDAGLTTDWDFPELMDGAYGYLPNDRRHQFKIYGAYEVIENLTMGFNFNLESGRPISAFGLGHPNVGEVDYGKTYYISQAYEDENGDTQYTYTKVGRGQMGRTSWNPRLDLNLKYEMELMNMQTQFRLDVFNVLNSAAETRVNEDIELGLGKSNPDYKLPNAFQTPRYVQLSASVKF